jgi:GTPase SAR1 family protein
MLIAYRSLPQLVVCGDQSAGKSSVLEALTEIPFPRNDNLCTRFATEIILRRAEIESLTIKVIPDDNRINTEKDVIRSFAETITDFAELPEIMDRAMEVMGIGADSARAFAKDVLSVEIEGPDRPQVREIQRDEGSVYTVFALLDMLHHIFVNRSEMQVGQFE